MKSSKNWNFIFLVWAISLVATAGSLFFSEVMNFIPCQLCWYQRICMYSILIITTSELIHSDTKVLKYDMILALIGLLISSYHSLLVYGVVDEKLSPCQRGISCADRWLNDFGFISIPLLSLTSFICILIIIALLRRRTHE